MTKKMLIDAAHPEEVRVAVLDNGKVEDFDFESEARKPLRGNIYLARVTRVEPSLQAAFVEYGGNRHGFLAFSEIHPDYYQIPVSDRRKLQEAEAEVAELAAELELAQRGDEDDYDHDDDNHHDHDHDQPQSKDARAEEAESAPEFGQDENGPDDNEGGEKRDAAKSLTAGDSDSDPVDEIEEPSSGEEEEEEEDGEETESSGGAKSAKKADSDEKKDADDKIAQAADDEQPSGDVTDEDFAEDIAEDADADASIEEENDDAESDEEAAASDASADDTHGEDGEKKKNTRSAAAKRQELFDRYKDAKRRRSHLLRNYKIQEVIKRRQILLIQVVKEERGNKGAALTTYMSLAGRYSVLMPNTARGGGISRKIPHSTDRKRLRRVVDSLDVPQGMGLIIRTAGAKRTKTEIKRDYDYLLRLWENIRTLTLKSIAPCLIYEEASLIKRAIRDLYDKDISEVQVEGDAGYREAKDYMKMLMPSHAKHVQPYKEQAPIFLKFGVEQQLDGMYQPSVRLKSGGYIVIHQTEALVAIDVNSGRATRERNIEQTALKTNIEAAYEAARQFRLRDLAGLVVLDFIDMEEQRNNRKVEKALKDAIKHDRARIQLGRISNFGLLELSRQRRRSGIVDGTTQSCPTCAGAGVIRSAEMAALRILRAVEGEAVTGKAGLLAVNTSLDVAVYILNHHRDWLRRIESEHGVSIEIVPDREKTGDDYTLEKSGVPRERSQAAPVIKADQTEYVEDADDAVEVEDDPEEEEAKSGERKKRRRRRRRKDAAPRDDKAEADSTEDDADADGKTEKHARDSDGDEEGGRKRRRRGRRGGRRNRRSREERSETGEAEDSDSTAQSSSQPADEEPVDTASDENVTSEETKTADEAAPAKTNGAHQTDKDHAVKVESDAEKPKEMAPEPEDKPVDLAEAPQPPAAPKPRKRGWWSRGSDA